MLHTEYFLYIWRDTFEGGNEFRNSIQLCFNGFYYLLIDFIKRHLYFSAGSDIAHSTAGHGTHAAVPGSPIFLFSRGFYCIKGFDASLSLKNGLSFHLLFLIAVLSFFFEKLSQCLIGSGLLLTNEFLS